MGKTPFEILYGYKPRQLGVNNLTDTPNDIDGWLQHRQEIANLLQQHLLRSQQRMKAREDKKRSERTFQVGDMVYMKLQPYTQLFPGVQIKSYPSSTSGHMKFWNTLVRSLTS
jgi:hypothetical protein